MKSASVRTLLKFWALCIAMLAALPPAARAAAAATLPATAEEGVRSSVRKESVFSKIVPAEQLEKLAEAEYRKQLQEAADKNALAPDSHPQVIRLRSIAQRMMPFVQDWNSQANEWKWEVNLIGSKQLNAFCMPGGKIAFYYGLLARLQLTDDEVAAIMGHEIAHALREHARRRMGKGMATQLGAGAVSAVLGVGEVGNRMIGGGAKLLTLKFSRDDESEADLLGMDLAARAGYNPAAGVTLWRKMSEAKGDGNEPLPFMSTHPSDERRIKSIETTLPRVEPLYRRAEKAGRTFGPPPVLKE